VDSEAKGALTGRAKGPTSPLNFPKTVRGNDPYQLQHPGKGHDDFRRGEVPNPRLLGL